MTDLGQSPRVKLLAANTRAAYRDFQGEHRIRLEGCDRADLEILADGTSPDTLARVHKRGGLTDDELAQLLELQARRQAELKIPSAKKVYR